MYSMVLMAALTTGIDMPDRGGRRGGCHGCWGGCYGGCWGGCYGGMGMGWGGCWGGCYGGMGMGWGGGGYGGGYVMGGYSPMMSGYAYSPMISSSGWGTPIVSNAGMIPNAGTTQSFYNTPTNSGNEATVIVHVPQSASLKIDGQPTQQSSSTRVFTSPPLEQGKTYVYKISAEVNRNGHTVRDTKNVEVRAGQRSEVTMNFGDSNRGSEERSEPDDQAPRRNNPPPASPRQPPDER